MPDNNNMNVQNESAPAQQPEAQATPNQQKADILFGQVNQAGNSQNTSNKTETNETEPDKTSPEEKVETPEEKPEPEKAEPALVSESFVSEALTAQVGKLATPEVLKEAMGVIKEIGFTDEGQAERAINWFCNLRKASMMAMTDEALKHYGGSFENPTPEYDEAMSKGTTAMRAIDKKVPGFAKTLYAAGLTGNLQMIQAMNLLYPLVCEDGNLMTGASNNNVPRQSRADILFGDLNRKE